MTPIVIVEARPWDPATGAAVDVRLAGGGRHHNYRGLTDWIDGVVAPPKITAAIGFENDGFTGGAVAQAGAVGFTPTRPGAREQIERLMWAGAPITVSTSATGAAFVVELSGTVAGYSIVDGMFGFTVSVERTGLTQPIAAGTFGGGGGIEGAALATGRAKRRSFGRCANVELRPLIPASNIYECSDPARPLQAIDAVRDRGRAGPIVVLAWAGSAQATLDALVAAQAPRGGGVVAPSIACVKWWTQASGPLCADIRGETDSGYVETVGGIAARLFGIAQVAMLDAAAWAQRRPDPAGLHIDNASETPSQALDRLLIGASVAWTITAAGEGELHALTFADPVEVILPVTGDREAIYKPVTKIEALYRHNHRRHSDGEISAAVLAEDVTYQDGTPIEALKPAGPGADKTSENTAGDTVNLSGRPAAEVLRDLDINVASIIAQALRQDDYGRVLDARTLIEGQPVGPLFLHFRNQATGEMETVASDLRLIGARSEDGAAWNLDLDAVRVGPNKTLSQRLTEIAASADGVSGAITELREVLIDGAGNVATKAVLALDANGRVRGLTATNTNGFGAIDFLFDSFVIRDPFTGAPLFAADAQAGVIRAPNMEIEKLKVGAMDYEFILKQRAFNGVQGSQELPGGVIQKWGRYRGTIRREVQLSVVFEEAFPSNCDAFVPTPFVNTYDTGRDLWLQNVGNATRFGAAVMTQAATSDNMVLDGFDWVAFGR